MLGSSRMASMLEWLKTWSEIAGWKDPPNFLLSKIKNVEYA